MKFSPGFLCHVPQIPEVPFLGSRCLGIFRPNSDSRDRVCKTSGQNVQNSRYCNAAVILRTTAP